MEVNISFSDLEYFKYKRRNILVIIRDLIMNLHPQIQPVSTGRMLSCLGLAIDEAKLVRSLIQSKDMVHQMKAEKSFSDRLNHLNREIKYLEKNLLRFGTRLIEANISIFPGKKTLEGIILS